MAYIEAKIAPYKVLQDFVDDKDIDIDAVLKNAELFHFDLYYKKYRCSVNSSAAKIIVDSQTLIYRLGALLKYNTTDIRRLSKAEKQRLEVPFEVKEGSTEISAEIIQQAKEIIEMVPENMRGWVIITLIICFFGNAIFKRWQEQKDKDGDKDLVRAAIDKLGESNSRMADLVRDYERSSFSNLEDFGDDITFQGENYTYDELKEIRRKRFPRKKATKPEAKRIDGIYRVVSINLEQKFINIKNGDDVEKVFYDAGLLGLMQDFKAKFKVAIDNEGRLFNIKAGYTVRNGKKSPLMLIDIEDVEQ